MASKQDRLIFKRMNLNQLGWSLSEIGKLKTELQLDKALASERSIAAMREREGIKLVGLDPVMAAAIRPHFHK